MLFATLCENEANVEAARADGGARADDVVVLLLMLSLVLINFCNYTCYGLTHHIFHKVIVIFRFFNFVSVGSCTTFFFLIFKLLSVVSFIYFVLCLFFLSTWSGTFGRSNSSLASYVSLKSIRYTIWL